jgi:hypothetical protein
LVVGALSNLKKGANQIKYQVPTRGYSLSGGYKLPLDKLKFAYFAAIVIELKSNFQTVTSKWQIWNVQGSS